MRQKFSITRTDRKELILKEFSELEKKEYTIIYQTAYDLSNVSRAAAEGVDALGALLRNEAFFPPEQILEKLTTAVMELMASKDLETVEVFIDDNQVFEAEDTDLDIDDEEVEAEDLDDILDDDDENLADDTDD